MYFYQRLRELRETNEKTQEEIAELLNITQKQYDSYESGKREIQMHKMIILSNYDGISLDYIAGLIDTPRKL